MILLLWILLIGVPGIWGAAVFTIVYRKKTDFPFSYSDSYLLGCITGIGITEVVHFLGFWTNMSLKRVGMLWGVGMLVLTLLCVCITVFGYFSNKNRYTGRRVEGRVETGVLIVFLILVGVQALFIYCMKAPVTAGDITLESVQSFLAQDGIYRVLPLTGQVSDQGIPMRYAILCLPTLYAVLSQAFDIEAQLLVCHVIPVIVLAASYLAYYRLSAALFGSAKQRKRFMFLLMVAVVLTVSDGAVFLDGYSLLHSGYTGVAIRNLVLIPYTLCAALEKRWWKAVLCILAEACMVWTFMGCGVCLVITLGILFLEILGNALRSLDKKEAQV